MSRQSKMQITVRDLRALAALTVNTTHVYLFATCLHLFILIYVLSCLLTFCVLSDTPLDQLEVYCLCLSTYILFLQPFSTQALEAASLQGFFIIYRASSNIGPTTTIIRHCTLFWRSRSYKGHTQCKKYSMVV